MFKYEIILYWSDEDQVFVAEVPELPGCMAHGKTQELALRQAKQAIRLWIDTAKEAERRFKEIQEGTVVCRPAEEVLRDAREKLKRK